MQELPSGNQKQCKKCAIVELKQPGLSVTVPNPREKKREGWKPICSLPPVSPNLGVRLHVGLKGDAKSRGWVSRGSSG